MFKASRVMAAVRFVELSPHVAAVVYSERGRVKWMKPSKTFPRYITKGTALAEGSIAFEHFERGGTADAQRSYSAGTWLGASSRVAGDTQIVESAAVIPEPGWGGVLSLLWIPQLVRAAS